MRAACALAIRKSVPLWIEPVSYDKTALVMNAEVIQHAFCIHPKSGRTSCCGHNITWSAQVIVHVSFCDVTRDAVHSEGTSIGMGGIYRLGDVVMAATNIKVSPTYPLIPTQ